jgi:pyridoxamine 5'-phosphate oxidase
MASVPHWKSAIEHALAKHKDATGELSTSYNLFRSLILRLVIQIATLSGTTPKVRSHIFRSFVSPSKFPAVPLLLTTTDIRTPKTSQIRDNPNVEITWWIFGTQEQFRIAGRAHVIPAPNHPSYNPKIGTGVALDALRDERFDWEAKRKEVFNEMSEYMKASWCRPTPGSRLDSPDDANSWPQKLPKLGEAKTDEDKKNLEMALGNFALVVIEPAEVDYVELGLTPNRRSKFVRKGKEEGWDEEAQVP